MSQNYNNQNYNNQGYNNQGYANQNQTPTGPNGVQERNIVMNIILSLVTCSVYFYIWMYQIEEDTARLTGQESKGGMIILWTILTCGIYGWVWVYRLGKDRMQQITGTDNSMMYVILAVLGLQLVNFALIQSDINNYINGGSTQASQY